MDVVVDCHGFCLRYNMDPRVVIGITELLRQPYRDRLRVAAASGWIVRKLAVMAILEGEDQPSMETYQANLRNNMEQPILEESYNCGGYDGGCADDDSAGLEHLCKQRMLWCHSIQIGSTTHVLIV